MTDDQHFRKLERMYLSAPVNQMFAPRIIVSKGATEVVFPVNPQHFHAAYALHGAIYFKAMDDAAFFAVNSLVHDVFVLTVSFNIHFMRPVSDGEIFARATAYFTSRQLYAAEVNLLNSAGKEIARGSGMFAKSKIQLSADVGYV